MAIKNGKVKKKSEQKSEKKEAKSSKNTSAEKDTVEKKPTKIVFTDDGEQRVVPVDYSEKSADTKSGKGKNKKGGNSSILSRLTQDDGDIPKRWYQLYEMFNTQGELIELKDAEITELKGLCRAAFEAECHARLKDNPSDAKWLQSAMEKGTTRDRASSGALLVQTNPFCNLPALETVIGMVKISNKGLLDAMDVLTELMIKSMMPSHRKLIPIQQRGADWKNLKKQEISKDLRDKVYAHWHFEEQLYELYFSFLTNISMVLHSGQEASKSKAVVYSAKLFEQIPEKEAFLLTMLVNKMGDPIKTVAVKALYHLTNVVRTHPAMALVVTTETEKLLFRNNVSVKAQHYGLSFLSTISVYGDFATCQKMINVCFSFFKILTEKGEVNSRMMQSILNCLRRAIGSIKRDVNLSDIVKPELMNVMFRLIHLSDISIACQGLSLLLEVTEAEGIAQTRFYNALYRKLIDPHLPIVGPRIANVLFHILHRAIQNDPRPERAQAFVKRLLQVAFYFPPALVCASLIVINKVIRKRKQLLLDGLPAEEPIAREEPEADAQSDDGEQDGEKKAKPAAVRNVKRYDGFHRASEFAGAQYTLKYELTRYLYHFHPTVQKFAASIISNAALTYYGDPLRDFALSHFLERFAFKNPKKPKPVTLDENGRSKRVVVKKRSDYVAVGSRALPVDMLTKDQCTEDDQYIFHFLEQKRERMQQAQVRKKAREALKKQRKKKKGKGIDDDDDDEELDSDVESIDDDEFDAYLDRLGVPGGQDDGANLDREELDFMQELEKDLSSNKKKEGKKGAKDDDDDDEDEDGLDDWDEVEGDEEDDNVGDSEDEFGAGFNDDEFSDGGSISLDEEGEQLDDDEDDEDDDEEEAPVAKKRKKSASSVAHVSDRAFAKKLKTADMNSLFAAADDFSEMLEGNADQSLSAKGAGGKRKKHSKNAIAGAHGTEMEVFNQDKSSVKQMAWEQTRFSGSNSKHYSGAGKKNFQAKNFAGAKKPFKGAAGGGAGKKFASKGKAKNRK